MVSIGAGGHFEGNQSTIKTKKKKLAQYYKILKALCAAHHGLNDKKNYHKLCGPLQNYFIHLKKRFW